MKKKLITQLLTELELLLSKEEREGDDIVALTEEYSCRIRGGYSSTNSTCANTSCGVNGDTNNSCTNDMCNSDNGMTNTACTNGTCS